jgi:hypothetical protein
LESKWTKQFQQVFRNGDVKAGGLPNLLVLKTTVEKYAPGGETHGNSNSAMKGTNYAEVSGSVSYFLDDVAGFWPVYVEVSSWHDHRGEGSSGCRKWRL